MGKFGVQLKKESPKATRVCSGREKTATYPKSTTNWRYFTSKRGTCDVLRWMTHSSYRPHETAGMPPILPKTTYICWTSRLLVLSNFHAICGKEFTFEWVANWNWRMSGNSGKWVLEKDDSGIDADTSNENGQWVVNSSRRQGGHSEG